MPDPRTRPTEYVTFLAGVVLAALVAFGVPLTEIQTAALIALVGALAPLVTTIIAHKRKESS